MPRPSNDPKFSDRQVWANIADPDHIAPKGADWSGSTLCHSLNIMVKNHIVQILG